MFITVLAISKFAELLGELDAIECSTEVDMAGDAYGSDVKSRLRNNSKPGSTVSIPCLGIPS